MVDICIKNPEFQNPKLIAMLWVWNFKVDYKVDLIDKV